MLFQHNMSIQFLPERPEGLPNWVWLGIVVVFSLYLFISKVWPKISPFLKDASAAFSAWKESRDKALEEKILKRQKEQFLEVENRLNADLDKRFKKFGEKIDGIFTTLKIVKGNDYEHAEVSRAHTKQLERVEEDLRIARESREASAKATNEKFEEVVRVTSKIEGQVDLLVQAFIGGGKDGKG